MDQTLRNKLRNVVTHCRKLLEQAINDALQGTYGIHTSGEIEDAARMTHLPAEDQQYRESIVTHLKHIISSGLKPKDAAAQLVREAAFTHLNRLCAYKMMATRGLIRDPVGKILKSGGFLFYLADHLDDEHLWSGGQQETAYRHYLEWLNGTLSEEIGVLFSPHDVASGLFPPHRVLVSVLESLNSEELQSVWSEDETIGWVYQYFTPKELRDQARKESAAPRNSYEMAFRNQFFTPRYVVEFLVDNTLGRTWYEMRKGKTMLVEKCPYLVRRPHEIFLSRGEEEPDDDTQGVENLSKEEVLKRPVYIKHRVKNDPREIRVLDPACGSGHFLLYCFDLLQTIYEEAYEDDELCARLKQDYPTPDGFLKAVPCLILMHNLHGIDIDLRAAQIAGFALWLRCQRAYKQLGINTEERPKITRTNIVCAEPMPGENELLEEFVASLQPRLLGQLVRVVFEKMKLAGEAGSLLKIEEEIRTAIADAKKLWRSVPKADQLMLFQIEKLSESEQPALFDLSGITDEQFWHEAEARVVESLREYAQSVMSNGRGLLRRLFANDAERGFAFVDLCRKRFDVVLMNPPFGDATAQSSPYFQKNYPDWANNILCVAIERGLGFLREGGTLGVIFDRTAAIKSSYEDFRANILCGRIMVLADTGWEVLDANVETTVHVLGCDSKVGLGAFFDILQVPADEKGACLLDHIQNIANGNTSDRTYLTDSSEFVSLPNSVIGYDFEGFVLHSFNAFPSLVDEGFQARQGHSFIKFEHLRLFWEIPNRLPIGCSKKYALVYNGGEFSYFYSPYRDVTLFGDKGILVSLNPSVVLRNNKYQCLSGVGYGKRGEFLDAHALRENCLFTDEGQAVTGISGNQRLILLAFLNSRLVQFLINKYCGQHKHCGYVNLLPFPNLNAEAKEVISRLMGEILTIKLKWHTLDETCLEFTSPGLTLTENHQLVSLANGIENLSKKLADDGNRLREIHNSINVLFEDQAGLTKNSQYLLEQRLERSPVDSPWPDISRDSYGLDDTQFFTGEIISHFLGYVFGRWDARYATGERSAPELPDPFAPLPVCAPGALKGDDGLPLGEAPPGYPLRVDWDGILVDDPDHEDDIIRRVHEVFKLFFKDRAEEIEREACELLGVKTLRDYFRKPAAGGFWTDHIKRYSKSRRKAPIYWLLQSSKKSYALWLYYHRLDKDILFKALQYVDLKIRLEETNLQEARSQRVEGATGREAREFDRKIEKHEALLSELRDFQDRVRRAAELGLEPDLNDGVVLNIAPLWEVAPWAEAKKYWHELLAGKYEWSSISRQLRERKLVKTE